MDDSDRENVLEIVTDGWMDGWMEILQKTSTNAMRL